MNIVKIDPQLIKRLRAETGAGVSECRQALVDQSADLVKAQAQIEQNSFARAAKKAHRRTPEGCLSLATDQPNEHFSRAVLIEVNCETDFVARHEQFMAFGQAVAQAILQSGVADASHLGQVTKSFETPRVKLVMQFGENVKISRIVVLQGPNLQVYLHGNGQLAAAVIYRFGSSRSEANSHEADRVLVQQIASTDLTGCVYLAPSIEASGHIEADASYWLLESDSPLVEQSLRVVHSVDTTLLNALGKMPVVGEAHRTFREFLESQQLALLAFAQLRVGQVEPPQLDAQDFASEVGKTLSSYQ